ncbi:NUDIX hydrolase [Nocardioides sp. Root122]|uniref:NUDIX hydrolase n=1 Tax=Nocardioides TaxID=1839 RepID=UPI000702ED45|nr:MULTISPECIES: CoA pyrophosphatase [Nocardioides]KQV63347.1 NUDIX hydrolase [Nocardioides sp. Root122]MCK9825555.1 CoA pyrophosphatase [Nocardioides cavernae]
MSTGLPGWLAPVVEAAATITVHELTRFMPPEDAEARRGAVLMVFADRAADPTGPDDIAHRGELLLTERAHHMRSHPGQVSFPGGSLDEGETPREGALREAYEEIGLEPSEVEVFGELPELWLPPSNFAVTPVLGYWKDPGEVRIASPDEVHEIHHVAIAELLDPEHRINVRHPSGWTGPGFLIGPDKDLILWGFTAGIVARLLDYLGWAQDWDRARVRDLPDHMLQGVPRGTDLAPNTKLEE